MHSDAWHDRLQLVIRDIAVALNQTSEALLPLDVVRARTSESALKPNILGMNHLDRVFRPSLTLN